MRRAGLALALVLGLAACKRANGPPCPTILPSTLLYEVYCDVQNRIFCLSPQYQNI